MEVLVHDGKKIKHVAKRLGVSPLLIGLTLVGFRHVDPGTRCEPAGSLVGAPGIAIGNIVGSSIFNILGIAGLTNS